MPSSRGKLLRERRLYKVARALFREREYFSAQVIFARVVRMQGKFADPARRYLRLIDIRSRGIDLGSRVEGLQQRRLYQVARALYREREYVWARPIFARVARMQGKFAIDARLHLSMIDVRRRVTGQANALAGSRGEDLAILRMIEGRGGREPSAYKARSSPPRRDRVDPVGAPPLRFTRNTPFTRAPHAGGFVSSKGSGAWSEAPARSRKASKGPARTSPKARAAAGEVYRKARGLAAPSPIALTDQLVRRTPHLKLAPDKPIEPGMGIVVEVYADEKPAKAGERSRRLAVRFPPGITTLNVAVRLATSGHFEVLGPVIQSLAIERDAPRSKDLSFAVRVRDRATLA